MRRTTTYLLWRDGGRRAGATPGLAELQGELPHEDAVRTASGARLQLLVHLLHFLPSESEGSLRVEAAC
jgi:hypothetical protein